jgi:hypothetical protein
MSSSSPLNFKVYDPIADLIAENTSGGSSAYQSKQLTANPNEIAIFGNGVNAGQTIASGFTIDTDLLNPQANDTLWPSSRIIGALQYGTVMYKATNSISIPIASNDKAFSTGNDHVGFVIWPNIGTTFTIDSTGVITIFNSLSYTTYFKIMFYADSLSATTANSQVICTFKTSPGDVNFGISKTLRAYNSTGHTNQIVMAALVNVGSNQSFNFYVNLLNNGSESVTFDNNNSFSYIVIDRIS